MKAVVILAVCLVISVDMKSIVSPTSTEAIVTVESDSTWLSDLEVDDWLTEEEIADLKEQFSRYDVDKDGTITTKEFETFMKLIVHADTQEELKHRTNKVDADGNGTIEFKEFITLLIGMRKDADAEKQLKNAYKFFDKDGDCYINSTELTSAMQTLGEYMTDDDMKKMFKDADIDGDEDINYEEFFAMLTDSNGVIELTE